MGNKGQAAVRGAATAARRVIKGVGRLADRVAYGMLAVVVSVTGAVTDAWKLRRGEEGGITDDALMIGMLALAAVAVAGAVAAVISGAIGDLESVDMPGVGD